MRLAWILIVSICLASASGAAVEFMPELRRAPETPQVKLRVTVEDASNAAEWAPRRVKLLKIWHDVIGPFPDHVPPLDVKVISTERLADHTRTLVRYQSDPDLTNDAYVLTPNDPLPAGGKRPGMVVLHPTTPRTIDDPVGISGRESVQNALHLVRRGYVCVVPRNFLWLRPNVSYQAATEHALGAEPWTTGMAKMTWDAMRATDLLLAQPNVDADRIGTIGHSLGGKEALYHAAFDERIKAAVSCEGGVGVHFSNWEASWYLGGKVKSPEWTRDHHELIALIAPRPLLIIGGESADGAKTWPYIEANLPLWRLFGAEDRIGLLRHTFKHDFPPPGKERDAVYQWLDHWLDK